MEKSHTFKVNNGGLQDGSIVLVKKNRPILQFLQLQVLF